MRALRTHAVDDPHALGDRLCRERADAILLQQVTALPVNALLGLSALPLMHRHGGIDATLLWFACNLIVNAARFTIARFYAQSDRTLQAPRYLRSCRIGSVLSGLVWATVPILFMDVNDPQSLFLIVIVAGIAAGATVQSAADAWMALGFVAPILLSSTLVLVCVETLESSLLAFDIMMFFAFLTKSGFDSQKAFRESQVLRHRATDLAAGLQELANNDPLTGLPNRAFFGYALAARLERAAAEGVTFFLLLVDLDHFKSINDTLGHTAGDIVLKEVGARLSRADGGRHAVARIGGDEFAILLVEGCSDDQAVAAAERIIFEAGGAFAGCGHQVTLGVSAGLAKFPDDGSTDEELLARADLALYAAKDAGRQRWQRFDANLLKAANIARDIEQDLPQALADGSLQVWFQPQMALGGGGLIGLEALIRWHHPRHGWLTPPSIVRAAMRLRLSESLTGFLLDHACRQIKLLDARGLDHVVVAVNVSPSEFDLYALHALVRSRIDAHAIAPDRLEIEITEEAFVGGEHAMATLNGLSAMGVRLAIDDFGTGCASIAYLRTLRVNRIKIDRCFISGFTDREGDRILVVAILGIGRSFGIEVVAEGVETEAEAVLLESFGCPVAQGYHFGYPMESETLHRWIENARGTNVVAIGAAA